MLCSNIHTILTTTATTTTTTSRTCLPLASSLAAAIRPRPRAKIKLFHILLAADSPLLPVMVFLSFLKSIPITQSCLLVTILSLIASAVKTKRNTKTQFVFPFLFFFWNMRFFNPILSV